MTINTKTTNQIFRNHAVRGTFDAARFSGKTGGDKAFVEIPDSVIRLMKSGSGINVVYQKALSLGRDVDGRFFLGKSEYLQLKLGKYLKLHEKALEISERASGVRISRTKSVYVN